MKIRLIEKDLIRIVELFGMEYQPLDFDEPSNYDRIFGGVEYGVCEIFHENRLTDFEFRML